MKQTLKSPIFIISFIVAVCMCLFAMYYLYQNSKTDGFNSGSIEIHQCQEKNYDWKIYECTGDYTHGVGDMGKSNVSVAITGREPDRGDVVPDIYPPVSQRVTEANYFVTGKERSSVIYNAPWLLLLFVSILLPICAASYLLGVQRSTDKKV